MKVLAALIPILLVSCNNRCFYNTYDYKTPEYVESHWYGDYVVTLGDSTLQITGRGIDKHFRREMNTPFVCDVNTNAVYHYSNDGENVRLKKLNIINGGDVDEYIFYNKSCKVVK